MALQQLDYWRLSDELSLIDAAILITGNDPSDTSEVQDDDGRSFWVQKTSYDGFGATFKALRNAVLSNRLRANLAYRARENTSYNSPYYVMGENVGTRDEIDEELNEVRVPYDILIRTNDHNVSIMNHRLDGFNKASAIYVLKEPDWKETTIDVSDLKRWLEGKGIAPTFFFPIGNVDGFRDTANARYSPKLACAVAAWEAVRKKKRGMSVKATVEEWVRANAVIFGMVGLDGVPAKDAVDQVSKVVNWATGGGANKTESEIPEAVEKVESFSNFFPVDKDSDEEIPF